MKKIFFYGILIPLIALPAICCSDRNDDNSVRIIPTMSLSVSDIADNMATIRSDMLTGTTVSAKVIDFYPVSDLSFDYNTEVKLVKFIEENGTAESLPYTKTIENGLRPGVSYISAIIAYNDKGRAVCSAFQIWQASGIEGMWSDDNSAGELPENNW